MPQGTRIDLHVGTDGIMDSPDYGSYGFAIHDFGAGGGQLRFTLPRINVAFDADWDEMAGGWRGLWRQDGLDSALILTRGLFPPVPVAADTFRLQQGVGQVVFDGARATLWSYSRRNEAQRVE